MKAEYIETPIEMNEESDVVLGEGDETVFGSEMVSEGVKVENKKESEEKLDRELDRAQAKKMGSRVMAWAKEYIKEQEEEERKIERNAKIGKFMVFAANRRVELGVDRETA